MTTPRTDPSDSEERTAARQQETLVTHEADHEITEQRTVDAAPAAAGSGARAATSRTVVRDEAAGRRRKVAQINQILWFLVGIIEVMVAARLILKLTAAAATDLTQLVFGVTGLFVMPFYGIFPNAAADSFEFEPASLVAMVVYFLIGLGLAKLVRILYGEPAETA